MRDASDTRLISCVVPHGHGHEILDRLFHEHHNARATVQAARGFSGSRPAGVFDRVEKEILLVVVPGAESEAVFAWLYEVIDVAGTPGCFMYQSRLSEATPFALPEGLPQEVP
jgi:hypothetical protein